MIVRCWLQHLEFVVWLVLMRWTFTKGSLSIMIWKILTNRIVIFWKNFPMKWCYRKKEEIPIVTIMLHAATQHCDSRKWFFFCENFTSIKNVHILHTIYIHLQCFVSFLCIHYPNRFLMYTFAHTFLLFFLGRTFEVNVR